MSGSCVCPTQDPAKGKFMETINQYQHVRLRPGMYGLHDNYFEKIFHQCILDLLHEFSFTTLKISTVPERNEITFEASERRRFHAATNYWSFILIAGISSFAQFSAEFRDGSFRRTIIKESEPCEDSFGIYHSPGSLDESSGFYPNTDLGCGAFFFVASALADLSSARLASSVRDRASTRRYSTPIRR